MQGSYLSVSIFWFRYFISYAWGPLTIQINFFFLLQSFVNFCVFNFFQFLCYFWSYFLLSKFAYILQGRPGLCLSLLYQSPYNYSCVSLLNGASFPFRIILTTCGLWYSENSGFMTLGMLTSSFLSSLYRSILFTTFSCVCVWTCVYVCVCVFVPTCATVHVHLPIWKDTCHSARRNDISGRGN